MLHALDIVGVVVFALTGALAAGRHRMDVFGVVVVAMVTALGGGTLRDLILNVPPFWVGDVSYLYVAAGAGLLTFVLARFIAVPPRALLVADAVGLGVFTVVGCERAALAGPAAVVVVAMGVMTAVTGGVVRDLLCNEVPLIMRRDVYATASLLGALAFVTIAARTGPGSLWPASVGCGIVVAVRLAAIRWKLSLPLFSERAEPGRGHRTDRE